MGNTDELRKKLVQLRTQQIVSKLIQEKNPGLEHEAKHILGEIRPTAEDDAKVASKIYKMVKLSEQEITKRKEAAEKLRKRLLKLNALAKSDCLSPEQRGMILNDIEQLKTERLEIRKGILLENKRIEESLQKIK